MFRYFKSIRLIKPSCRPLHLNQNLSLPKFSPKTHIEAQGQMELGLWILMDLFINSLGISSNNVCKSLCKGWYNLGYIFKVNLKVTKKSNFHSNTRVLAWNYLKLFYMIFFMVNWCFWMKNSMNSWSYQIIKFCLWIG